LARDLATWDYEARRLAVLGSTIKAFVATLAAQERVDIAAERMQVADETARGVAAQVDAGAARPVDLARARVAAGRAEVAHRRAIGDLAMARGSLAATWGSGRPSFARVQGSLRALDDLPANGADAPSIARNPDVARWETEQARRASALALAEAGRIPDVSVGAGGRYFSDRGDGALVFELSVPLPLLDRGQAAVEVARHRLARTAAERRAVERATEVALAAAYDRFAAARAEAVLLHEGLIPEARQAVAAAADAFRNGMIHFTDLLDAELASFEMREDEIRALEEAHAAAVDIARLTGTPPGWVEQGGDE
jgi:cobalt-zinc-cadmium efflux system outer membrane protein